MRRNEQQMMSLHRPPIVQFTPRVFGFPDRILTKLRYSDIKNLSSTLGASANYRFRWNSIFDPDQSGTGHQPLYFDTYASVYDHYAVVSAKMKVLLVNQETSLGIICGVVTDDDASSTADFNILSEQNHGISTYLTPLSGSSSEKILRSSWNCQQILNIDPFSSETYKTDVGSNPTEESYCNIWSISQDGSSTTVLRFKIDFEYEVLFSELKTPSLS